MSDSYRSELILVNRAVGVAETRAQIDTITKSVAQLAREDALYTQKQATYARQREAASRREATARQSAEIASMRAVEQQEQALRNYQIQWAKQVAQEKTAAARQAAQAQLAAERQAAQEARAQARATAKEQAALAKQAAQAAREQASAARQAALASRREAANRQAAEIAAARAVERQERELRNYQIQWAREVAKEKAAAAQQAAREQVAAARQAAQQARAASAASSAEEKAAARRTVFGMDTGVDIKNFAAGLYTVQAAYHAVAQAASIAMDAIQEAAKWEKYSVAIATMEGSATVAAQSLKELYDIAKAPGIDLEGANKSYLQLRAIGIEGDRTKRIISEFANTVARSGGGGVEFERVNRQLVQMLANGRVLESELKWMKESMPELAKVMQATFGTTSAEGIRNLGISAQEFVNRTVDALAELPRAQSTLTTEIENVETAWSRAKAAFIDKEFWSQILSNTTSLLEAFVDIREEIDRSTKGEAAQKKAYSEGALLGWLKRVGANYAPGGLEITGELAAGTNRQRTQLQLQSDAIIRAMQNGMGGALSGQLRADNPLTGYWASEAARLAEQERQAEADKTKKTKPTRAPREPRFEFSSEVTTSGAHERELADKLFKAESARQRREDDVYWAQVAKKKQALEEIASVTRTAKEQELVEAAMWREKMLASIGDDNAAYLRLEEAYGKKLADINDKYNKQIVEDEKKRQKERMDAMESFTSGMGSLAGAMGGLIIQMNDQNTEAYAAMVAIQQGFAIAQATMNMWVAMSNALTLPYPANLAAIGQVAAAGGQIVSAITAMNVAKVGKGFFDNGGTLGYGEWGIAGERGPEIIEGPARITSRRDTASMMKGNGTATGTVVNVHNYAGASVATKTNDDGSIDLIIERLEDRLAEGIYSGSGKASKAMAQSFGLRRQGR